MGCSSVYSDSIAKTAKEIHSKRAIMNNNGLLFYHAKTAKKIHAKRAIMDIYGSIVLSRKDRKGDTRKEGDHGLSEYSLCALCVSSLCLLCVKPLCAPFALFA
jgi:hypothetical protein